MKAQENRGGLYKNVFNRDVETLDIHSKTMESF